MYARAPRCLAAALLGLAFAVQAAEPLPQRLTAARAEAGVDPQRALATLDRLREEAMAAGRVDWRVAVDAAACRVLSDLDGAKALAVTDAGLKAAGAAPQGSMRDDALRLRACRAGVLIDSHDPAAGRRELEAVLTASAPPQAGSAHAIALIERGVARSRAGEYTEGQADLIEACEALRGGAPPDRDLCLGHLANHYKRVGDNEEALRLLADLQAGARQRGADYDDSIYTYAVAQVHDALGNRPQALANYRAMGAICERIGDRSGVAYAEQGVAAVLLDGGDAAAAEPHSARAMQIFEAMDDPRQLANAAITRAKLLVDLDRAAEAQAALQRAEAHVRQRNEDLMSRSYYAAEARVHAAFGRWKEAYAALDRADQAQQRLHARSVSEQSARLRAQYNRQRDADDLSALRRLNEQGQRLRQMQAVALTLFVVLLLVAATVAVRKFRQARHLHALASTDELTGVANRRALIALAEDVLARLRRDGGRAAVLMLDVDHFKRINDTHGHAVGDDVLRHLARVVAASLREHDRLGRIGGEEFLAVLPDATLVDARSVAERMRAAIAATPIIGPTGEVRFTVSIGVAGAERDEPVAALIARADAALYRAKGDGRNRVVVDDAARSAA